MKKPEWFRTSDPVIRNPARYCWTTAPAYRQLGKLVNVIRVNPGRPTVNVCICGIQVKALVDTGASCSLLRQDVFQQLVIQTHRTLYINPTVLLKVTGTPLDMVGRICINGIQKPIDIVIASMILGDPTRRQWSRAIDYRRNVLVIHCVIIAFLPLPALDQYIQLREIRSSTILFDFIECFTTFLRAHSWLNWVDRSSTR